jgi:GH18 family chitinase
MCDFVFYEITTYNKEKAKLVLTNSTGNINNSICKYGNIEFATSFKDFHLNLFRDALRIGTKMVLSLGSYGEENMSAKSFMIALANDKSRAEFLDQIISLVVKFNFAGVAFHWIYPGCPQVFFLHFSYRVTT